MHLFLVTFSSYKNTVICIKTINLPYLSKLLIICRKDSNKKGKTLVANNIKEMKSLFDHFQLLIYLVHLIFSFASKCSPVLRLVLFG